MTIIMPEYLIEKKLPTASAKDVCLASYRVEQNEYRSEIFVSESMITYIVEGSKDLIAAESHHLVHAGEFCFVPKGNYIISSLVPPEGGVFTALLVFLSDSIIRDFIESHSDCFAQAKGVYPERLYHCKAGKLLVATVQSFAPYLTEQCGLRGPLITCKVNELLLNILEDDRSGTFRSLLKDTCGAPNDDLAHYMQKNYCLPLTVEEFAKNTFRSLTRFKKEFKARFHETPKRWINGKRLEKAYMLLSSGSQSVTEICFLCGFESLSYFIQLFRKRYGVTPKQYQRSVIKP